MPDPNLELLLTCSRPAARAEDVQAALLREIDWDRVLDYAAWHCVGPLLYKAVREAAPGHVPTAVLDSLRAAYEANFRRNLFLAGSMTSLAAKFRERNITAIALKGPVLCTFYGDLGLREFGDLDFLVHHEDVQRAVEFLAGEGFRPHLDHRCAEDPRALHFARTFHYEMTYINDASCKVDLHWALMTGFWTRPHEVNELWQRVQPVALAGGSVLTLSREDTLLLLCAHGAKHMWRSLGWICDVAALLGAAPDLNWNAIFERATRFRVTRALSLGLGLAADLLNAPVPEEPLSEIQRDAAVQKLAGAAKRVLFSGDGKEGALESCVFQMRTREHPQDAIRCGMEWIFHPTMAEWRSLALPQVLFPAYYFLRPIRLLAKHGFGE